MRKLLKFKKETEVEKHSKMHVELVYQCVHKLNEIVPYFYKGDYDAIDKIVREITEIEHKADDIRRAMELEFYRGAFLPFDREDRIILAEQVDDVADATQESAYRICLSRVRFPKTYEEDFAELVSTVCDCVSVLKECIGLLDVNLGAAILKAHDVEKIEEEVDKIERRILRRLYKSYRKNEFGILTLLEFKEVVRKIGDIADRAEDASDRVPIMAAKRGS